MHCMFGHVSLPYMKQANIVRHTGKLSEFCKGCAQAKLTRSKRKKNDVLNPTSLIVDACETEVTLRLDGSFPYIVI